MSTIFSLLHCRVTVLFDNTYCTTVDLPVKNEDVFSFFHRTLKQLEEQFFPLNLTAAYHVERYGQAECKLQSSLNSVTHHRRYQVQFVK